MKKYFKQKTVAVVGNSMSLFEKDYGSSIDKNDIVIRINRGILIKDESKQGKKTDVWAYATERVVSDLFSLNLCSNTIHLSKKQRFYKNPNYKKKIYEGHPCSKYYIPLDVLEKLNQDLTFTIIPSSGLIITYYLSCCDPKEVNLYGFDWKETPTWYRNKKDDHDWNTEKNFFLNFLLTKTNINLFS